MSEPVPLCVDLDGTLIRSDLLHESFAAAFRRDWFVPVKAAYWLAIGGKALLKTRLAERARLDVTTLPYQGEVVEWVRGQKAAGRRVVLATAAAKQLADGVAAHLDLFDQVLSTDGSANLKSNVKLQAIRDQVGPIFDYVGDCKADHPIFAACAQAHLVTPGPTRHCIGNIAPLKVERPSRVTAVIKLLRPHQWLKNGLVLVPLMTAHQLQVMPKLIDSLLAMVVFSLIASAVYVLNDFLDVQADRLHHRKRNRPLASGAVPLLWAFPILGLLVLVSAGICLLLPWQFAAVLSTYAAISIAYSFHFKSRMLQDVILLAGLYTIRIFAGGAATGIMVSPWLFGLSMMLFLSLAFAKRYVELKDALQADRKSLPGRGYVPEDLQIISAVGPASGYIAVMILAMYVSGETSAALYKRPHLLWLTCPILTYWITRTWFLANRGTLHDDPVVFAATDKVSWIAVIVCLLVGIMAAW